MQYLNSQDLVKAIEQFVQSDKPLTAKETAEFLGISRNYLYQLVHNKRITHHKGKGGKMLYFKRADLIDYMNGIEVPSDDKLRERAASEVAKSPIGRAKYRTDIDNESKAERGQK